MRFILLVTCLFVSSIAFSNVRATFDYKQFLIPGQGFFIETHLSFDGRSLFWEPIGDDQFQASVEATLVLNQGGDIIDFKKMRINSLPESEGSGSDFIDIQRFMVQPGDYLLEVKLTDLNDPDKRVASFSQVVSLDLQSDSPCISGITFVEAYAKASVPSELTKSGMDILPLVSDFFPESANKIVFYAEAYNADKSGIEGEKYLLTYSIWSDDGEITETKRFKRKDVTAVTPLLETIDISELPAGDYQLVIEMRTPQNDELASESIGFVRQAEINSRFPDFTSRDTYVDEPGRAFNNPDSIRAYVSWLYPIAQNVERGTIDTQVKENNTEVLQSYFISFWEERNPEDPMGAWMTYVREVWYVNKKYKTQIQDGYRTDRGRVFLQYGKPNTIVIRHSQTNVFPYEIWHYYKIERFNDKRFLFYSRSVVNYDFTLLHSDMLGEVQNHDWPTLMRTKNNDLRPTDSALNRMAPRDTYSMDELEDLFYNPR